MSNQANCESCGALLTPGVQVCESCGQPVSGAGSAGQVSAESWSQPSQAGSASSQPATDRWGTPQPEPSAHDPGRWGSPQPPAGSSARPVSAAPSGGQSFDADSAVSGVKETARKGGKWLLIGGAALLLGCICLAAVLVLFGGSLFSWLGTGAGGGF